MILAYNLYCNKYKIIIFPVPPLLYICQIFSHSFFSFIHLFVNNMDQWGLIQAGSCILLTGFHHLKSISLLPSTTEHSQLILYLCYPGLGISHLFQEPWFLLTRNGDSGSLCLSSLWKDKAESCVFVSMCS